MSCYKAFAVSLFNVIMSTPDPAAGVVVALIVIINVVLVISGTSKLLTNNLMTAASWPPRPRPQGATVCSSSTPGQGPWDEGGCFCTPRPPSVLTQTDGWQRVYDRASNFWVTIPTACFCLHRQALDMEIRVSCLSTQRALSSLILVEASWFRPLLQLR